MHNSVGVGSKAEGLEFLAAQQGFAGRHPELFRLVDEAEDLDAPRASAGSR